MNFPIHFICASSEYADFDRQVPAPYLRRSFPVAKEIRSAELVITGLGFYRVFLNGTELTKCILAPYISNPDQWIYYDRYEVKQYLRPGKNVIGVMLGNGMQNCFGGYVWDFDKARWRSAPMTALRLTMTAEDGTAAELESDEQFRTHPSPLWFDELRCGEYYDARRELDGWCSPDYDDSGWKPAQTATPPRGEQKICEAEPIVVSEELAPVSVTPYEDGYLYDFGVNAAGTCRLKIRGTAGQEIFAFHGEWYHDGKLEQKNIVCDDCGDPRAKRVQCSRYICRGTGEEIFTPHFTYFGFRYVYLRGVTKEQAVPELLTYLVMHGDFREVGSFSCSDETANTLQKMVRRSDLSNFLWFPTDCPHREKNGWTGDAALSTEHMLLNLSAEKSLREWLRNIVAAQDRRGAIPGIIPTGDWGFAWGNGPAWDWALIEIPYCIWRLRGDLEPARESGTAIFRYLHYIARQRNSRGLVAIGLGDWCTPGRDSDQYKSPLEVTDTAVCVQIAQKAALLFGALGWDEERRFALLLQSELREQFRSRLIDFSAMTVVGACQTSQVIAIAFDLFEPAEKAAAFARLKELITDRQNHIDCGIIGMRVLFHVLSDFDEADLAYEMMTRPDYPSYGNWIERGATSLWEDFQPEGHEPHSLNHHFFGDISSWMIQSVAGIMPNPRAEDVNSVRIAPHFIRKLSHAGAQYDSPAGKISVRWERRGGKIVLAVQVPQGMSGTLRMPRGWELSDGLGEIPLASGEFCCSPARLG